MNYAKSLARDTGGSPMQEYPAPFKTVASVFYRDNIPPSSIITLDQNTSALEVGAFGGQGIVIRWIPTGESGPAGSIPFYTSVVSSGLGANYDHWVPPSTVRRFVVPKETGGAPTGAVGSVNGLYQRVAVSNNGAGVAGASSVFIAQY